MESFNPSDNGPAVQPKRAERPVQTLPTDRITFSKQLEILRAYGVVYSTTAKPVGNSDISELMKMKPSTVSLANPFFASIELLLKSSGKHIPSPAVQEFVRAYEWKPETAAQKLSPAFKDSWFARAVLPKLSFGHLTEDEAIAKLADASRAHTGHRNQLRVLLEYLKAVGLIEWEDGSDVRPGPTAGESVTTKPVPESRVEQHAVTPKPITESAPSPERVVSTTFAQSPQGVVQFHVSVRVDMAEFSGWQPDRITAFFGGIAQVLAAKAKVETASNGGNQ